MGEDYHLGSGRYVTISAFPSVYGGIFSSGDRRQAVSRVDGVRTPGRTARVVQRYDSRYSSADSVREGGVGEPDHCEHHPSHAANVAIKQRMSPTADQRAIMLEHCQHVRFVYNIGLEQRQMWMPAKRHFTVKIGYVSQARELTELRKDLDWLRSGSSVVQQGALRDLDRAFTNFFERRARYPQFKRRSEREGSFVVRDVVVHRLNRRTATALVPKVGAVRFRLTRPWAKVRAASSARVSLRAGQWHVAFTTEPPEKIVAGTGAVVGVDRGVANTIATSDGAFAHAPAPNKHETERLALLQQRLARQHKGSRRRARTVDAIAHWHLRAFNRRHDWVEKITTDLARTYDVVAIERLQITNMTKRARPKPDPDRPGLWLPNGAAAKSGLNKAILGQCWGQLATRLNAKMPAGAVISVPAAYTSQQCPRCGTTDAANRESQAVFACIICGYTHHVDTNAAVNILSRALPGSDINPRTSGARTRQFLGENAEGASTTYASRNPRS